MTRDQHLQFCKKCDNKKLDLERGLVCSLTNEFADFSVSCDNYSENTSSSSKSQYTYSTSEKVYDVTAGKRLANYFIDRNCSFRSWRSIWSIVRCIVDGYCT